MVKYTPVASDIEVTASREQEELASVRLIREVYEEADGVSQTTPEARERILQPGSLTQFVADRIKGMLVTLTRRRFVAGENTVRIALKGRFTAEVAFHLQESLDIPLDRISNILQALHRDMKSLISRIGDQHWGNIVLETNGDISVVPNVEYFKQDKESVIMKRAFPEEDSTVGVQ